VNRRGRHQTPPDERKTPRKTERLQGAKSSLGFPFSQSDREAHGRTLISTIIGSYLRSRGSWEWVAFFPDDATAGRLRPTAARPWRVGWPGPFSLPRGVHRAIFLR
jgi:hypothetical protein